MGWADDCEAIRQTISLYCQLLDDQRYDEMGRLFALDAVMFWQGTTTTGRDQIVAGMPATQLPLGTSRHLPYGPVIRIEADTASVWTDVMVTVHPADAPAFPGWVGRYHQHFTRADGRWFIAAHIALGIGDAIPDGVEIVDSRTLG